jgi:serine/threonine-protein kinase HipA
VPASRLIQLNNPYRTFCVQRFDRVADQRRFYASAMTLLRKDQSEGSSYLELAQFLRAAGDAQQVKADLVQLFRRVAFNVAVGNPDDHLRNHGFILNQHGWRLAPAFDINPNTDRADHVLNIDDSDNRPSLHTVLSTAAFYGLSNTQARTVVQDVADVVANWPDTARHIRLCET